MKKQFTVKWVIRNFESLSPAELYAILQLRNDVFVVEQNCIFQDADNKDQQCIHVMGWNDAQLLAYSRIADPGVMYEEAGIGRVVTARSVRRQGLGKELIITTLEEIARIHGRVPVKLGAQLYLKNFYSVFGFQPEGEIYLEDGIEHIRMSRAAPIS